MRQSWWTRYFTTAADATVRLRINRKDNRGASRLLQMRGAVFIEKLDTEQTAQHLGIQPGTVKTRLHRARQARRTLLEPLVLGELCG
jgi:hypothetical protein